MSCRGLQLISMTPRRPRLEMPTMDLPPRLRKYLNISLKCRADTWSLRNSQRLKRKPQLTPLQLNLSRPFRSFNRGTHLESQLTLVVLDLTGLSQQKLSVVVLLFKLYLRHSLQKKLRKKLRKRRMKKSSKIILLKKKRKNPSILKKLLLFLNPRDPLTS